MKDQQIKEMLSYDALSEAEKVTGKSYKEDKLTESIGMINFLSNNEKKNEMLSNLGDTCFSEDEDSYMKKVTEFGFKEVLLIPFVSEDGVDERFHIMWHDDFSILLAWDTHSYKDDGSFARAGEEVPKPSRNSGNFYFNWSSNERYGRPERSSNGLIGNGDKNRAYDFLFNQDFTPHILPKKLRDCEPKLDWDNYEAYREKVKDWNLKVEIYIVKNNLIAIYEAEQDSREAIKFNINQLAKSGTFLKKWKKQPFLWLVHHGDTKVEGRSSEKINKERISQLPKYIQEIIKGE